MPLPNTPGSDIISTKTTDAINAVVAKNRRMFRRYADVSHEDIAQEAAIKLFENRHRYDPAKSAPQTFAGLIAKSKLIDTVRNRARHSQRDQIAAAEFAAKQQGEEIEGFDKSLPLSELIPQVYRHAACLLGKPCGRWPGHPPAVRAVVRALHQRGYKPGQIRAIMDDSGLQKRLGLRGIPSRMHFFRMCNIKPRSRTNKQAAMGTKSNSDMLTEKDAADLLGFHLETLKGWRRDGKCPIPFLNINDNIRYRRSDVDAYLEKARVVQTQGS